MYELGLKDRRDSVHFRFSSHSVVPFMSNHIYVKPVGLAILEFMSTKG